MYRLLFEGRDSKRAPFVARGPQTVIGREAGCALQLADGGISDRHAAIERRADGYYLRDLDSANGVRVNGQLVAEHRLGAGDEIELGSVRLRFEIVHEPPPGSRTVDTLAWTAGSVIAVLVIGQLALFAWIFSTPRPLRDTPIDTGKNPIQFPGAAQPLAPAADIPILPVMPSLPVPTVLNRMLKIQHIDRADAGDNVTLKIPVKAQVGERQLDAAATAVCVQFFAGADAVPGKPVWLNAPSGWENFSTRTFTARFFGPPQQCAGYVVRTYYRKQLQDAVATPPALLTAAPAPTP